MHTQWCLELGRARGQRSVGRLGCLLAPIGRVFGWRGDVGRHGQLRGSRRQDERLGFSDRGRGGGHRRCRGIVGRIVEHDVAVRRRRRLLLVPGDVAEQQIHLLTELPVVLRQTVELGPQFLQ